MRLNFTYDGQFYSAFSLEDALAAEVPVLVLAEAAAEHFQQGIDTAVGRARAASGAVRQPPVAPLSPAPARAFHRLRAFRPGAGVSPVNPKLSLLFAGRLCHLRRLSVCVEMTLPAELLATITW